ncbi:unnamed protein product [Arabidopsis thaliana]|uniref:(thale cress) hypothetical protein n=1 Tax=Arabidopsis thaliana TaxID=3702 RepID=A0A7G2FB30_ARATH|nr:unnamed protein product [Arabidopsis thaliana]
MDESSASTWKLWRLQITKESSSADRDSSLAPLDVVILVLEALNSVTRMLHSVVPPPLLVRKRRTWLNLMGLRFGPSPSLLCPPSCPLPKALKPTKTSADLCPRLLRPWSCFNSILNSPNFLKLSSFRDCYGRLPVMVMMDLVWISCYLSQNLVASSYRVVRLRDCPSLISTPFVSDMAGYGRQANRELVCLGWNDRVGYRFLFNLTNPTSSSVEHIIKSSDALFARISPSPTSWSNLSILPTDRRVEPLVRLGAQWSIYRLVKWWIDRRVLTGELLGVNLR